MSSRKKRIREMKMKHGLISRPLICKIEIMESGKKVMDYKGGMKDGFKQFRALCEDVFQVVDKKGEKSATE